MNCSHKILMAVAALALPAFLMAADDLPKAETIMDKYVEATGGKAAYEKHHSVIIKGTLVAAMGIKGTVTSYHVDPDKSYSEADLPGIGKMRDGSDGKVYWSLSGMLGPHIKEGTEKVQAMLEDQMSAELNWRKLFKDVKTTGVDTVDGSECYKVELTPSEGKPITQCYDRKSGLLVKMSMTVQSPIGEIATESYPGDYRKEGDLLMAHKIKQTEAGQEAVFTIDSVTLDADIPADKFELPDEIKALANKK